MNRFLLCILTLLCVVGLAAEWNTDPSQPTVVANGAGEQVIPKVAINADGYSYVSYFDNGFGNYNVRAKRFDPTGNNTFDPPNGILVSSNTSDTWLTDWDMTVSQDGGQIITWQDIRSATNNVYVYKLSSTGAQVWGANGIALSTDTDATYANYTPVVINTPDDNTYVAWQRTGTTPNQLRIQRINPQGTPLWGDGGQAFGTAAGSYTWPQFLLSENNDILMKYFVDSGPFWAPTRHIYVIRWTPDGTQVWNTPISTAGGISAWNQIIAFESDGAGGAILSWYDDRNNDQISEVYVAHVTAAGVVTTPQNGALITGNTGNQQYYPKVAVDTAAQQIYVYFKYTDADQNNSGLGAQKLDFSGNQAWGTAGISPETMSSYVVMPEYAWMTPNGAACIYERGTTPSSDMNMNLRACCLTQNGSNGWATDYVDVATDNTPKLHFDFSTYADGRVIAIWESGSSANDVYATRINGDGTLGNVYSPPVDLSYEMVSSTSIMLSWNAPAGGLTPSGYAVFQNGISLITLPAITTSYLVEALTPGQYFFYVVAEYPGDHYSLPSNTVNVTMVSGSDPVSPAVNDLLTISPNPCVSFAELRWQASKAWEDTHIDLYNLKGQLVRRQTIPTRQGENSYVLELDGLAKGLYLVRIASQGSSVNGKLLIRE